MCHNRYSALQRETIVGKSSASMQARTDNDTGFWEKDKIN
jgi:hypothetical protein